jgi:hypothetical protein
MLRFCSNLKFHRLFCKSNLSRTKTCHPIATTSKKKNGDYYHKARKENLLKILIKFNMNNLKAKDMDQRDNFSQKIKETLAKRVGTLCSNTQCSVPTYGPNENPDKSTNKGVAAHIKAAAPGGPRYDNNMSPSERSSIDNSIWLCESCAKLIDTDEKKYTVEILQTWKNKAEDRAKKSLENPRIVNIGSDFADTILFVTRQYAAPGLTPPQDLPLGYEMQMNIKLVPIQTNRKLLDTYVPFTFNPGLLKEGECLICIACQNQGTGVDQFIKIDIDFKRPAIFSIKIDNPTQVQLINGGAQRASYASFMIRDLLPGEYQGIRIVAKQYTPFSINLWSQNSGQSSEVFIYDVIFGAPIKVPKDKS